MSLSIVESLVKLERTPDSYGNTTCFKWDESEYETKVLTLEERKTFVKDRNLRGEYWFLHDTEGFCYLVRKVDQVVVGVIESQYMNIGNGNMYGCILGMIFYPSDGFIVDFIN